MAQEGWKLEQEEAPCTPPAAAPSLCSNNCGFFGSAATMNLCSSCFKTLVVLKPKSPAQIPVSIPQEEPEIEPLPSPSFSSPAPPPPSSSSSSSPSLAVAVAVVSSSAAEAVDDALPCCGKAQQPLRCFSCQKKVGLRGFKCRCGDVFCVLHRYSDKHSCSFDYKAAGRASIAKANPVVKADKLHRI